MSKKCLYIIPIIAFLLFQSCNTTKYVPENAYLLNKATVKVDEKSIDSETLSSFIKPRPNYKLFGIWKLQLHLYNMSGKDSTKLFNKWLRKLGTPPVLYDESASLRSAHNMEVAFSNKGYIHSGVTVIPTFKKKKVNLEYVAHLTQPYRVRKFSMDIRDDSIRNALGKDTLTILKKGMLFDSDVIDEYRENMATLLRRRGYYRFSKEYIHFIADSSFKSHEVDLVMKIRPYQMEGTLDTAKVLTKEQMHPRYYVNDVYFITNYDPLKETKRPQINRSVVDSLQRISRTYKGYYIYDIEKKKVRSDLLVNSCYISHHSLYNERLVDLTYNSMGSLSAMKSINVYFVEKEDTDSIKKLDCLILLSFSSPQSFTTNVEGTNTAGDFGVAGSVNYQHRNIFKGSETFNVKVRGAYEMIGGDFSEFLDNYFYELGTEGSLTFPKFLFPFLNTDFRRRMRASTQVALSYDLQSRPEFQRTVAATSFTYKWNRRQKTHYTFDLFDMSYVYLPWVSESFKEDFLNDNSYLKYSYESHLILRSGIGYTYTSLLPGTKNRDIYTIRANFESAGNILWLASKAFRFGKIDDYYTIMNLRYEQYVKATLDYAKQFFIDDKNSIAFHIGAGAAVPYGNTDMVPFEKRYFSGGANSVRGWSVRSLGPGRYAGASDRIDYVNQSGDIKLDVNLEYRSRLFWKIQTAAFVDAGNIWTIRKYETQPGGEFDVKRFYKEIAMAYGLGLRLDFDYFLIRLDFGMKAYNPIEGKLRWPLLNPNISRDMAVHFAIGYPF